MIIMPRRLITKYNLLKQQDMLRFITSRLYNLLRSYQILIEQFDFIQYHNYEEHNIW